MSRDDDRVLRAVRQVGCLADEDAPSTFDPKVSVEDLIARVAPAADGPLSARRLRLPTLATAIAVLVGASGIAVATTLTSRDGPAREEVSSYAADARIPDKEASEHLADQSKLGQLGVKVRAAVAGAFGGLWVDSRSHDRIKVAILEGSPPVVRDRVKQIVADVGLSASVDIVTTTRPERQLLELQAQIDADLVKVNKGATAAIDVEPDLPNAMLVLRRPPTVTARQKKYIAYVAMRLPDRVEIRDGSGRLNVGLAGD